MSHWFVCCASGQTRVIDTNMRLQTSRGCHAYFYYYTVYISLVVVVVNDSLLLLLFLSPILFILFNPCLPLLLLLFLLGPFIPLLLHNYNCIIITFIIFIIIMRYEDKTGSSLLTISHNQQSRASWVDLSKVTPFGQPSVCPSIALFLILFTSRHSVLKFNSPHSPSNSSMSASTFSYRCAIVICFLMACFFCVYFSTSVLFFAFPQRPRNTYNATLLWYSFAETITAASIFLLLLLIPLQLLTPPSELLLLTLLVLALLPPLPIKLILLLLLLLILLLLLRLLSLPTWPPLPRQLQQPVSIHINFKEDPRIQTLLNKIIKSDFLCVIRVKWRHKVTMLDCDHSVSSCVHDREGHTAETEIILSSAEYTHVWSRSVIYLVYFLTLFTVWMQGCYVYLKPSLPNFKM